MLGWIIGIPLALIIIMVIIKRATRRNRDYGIWEEARGIGRGACKKILNLFGC